MYNLHRREMKVGKHQGKQVYLAKPVLTARVSFDHLCKQLADGSTVDAADVKAVLSRMATVISRNLEMGMSVDCGELGLFRPSFGSKGVEAEDEFNASLITPARVVFTPRKAFKNSLRGVGYERVYRASEAELRGAGKDKSKDGGKPSGPNGGRDEAAHAGL